MCLNKNGRMTNTMFIRKKRMNCCINGIRGYFDRFLHKNLLLLALCVFCGSLFVSVSAKYKAKSINKTERIAKQCKTLLKIQQRHNDFLQKVNNTSGALQRFANSLEQPGSMKKLLAGLESNCYVSNVKFDVKKRYKREHSKLVDVDLSLKLKSENDRNVVKFINNFEKQFPGVIVFHSIVIERMGKILSKEDFWKELELRKSQNKKFLKFKSKIFCRVTTTSKQAKRFFK